VPENLKTAEMCLEAVKNYTFYLDDVPENLRTAEVCLEVVKKGGSWLKDVPENIKTAEICLEAVMNDGNALEYVPKNLWTAEMCLKAIRDNESRMANTTDFRGEKESTFSKLRAENARIFEEMPEKMREEVRRKLEENKR